MNGVDYSGICDLARDAVLDAIQNMMQDRMGQGEQLDSKGHLSWPGIDNNEHDNEVFGAYESYLAYIHHVVEDAPIPLRIES